MGRGHVLTVVMAVVMAVSAGSEAATYYVRKTGNDSWAGTGAGTAFRTIGKAASVAGAGDVVHVGAGTYTEEVSPGQSGSAVSPVRYMADVDGTFTGDAGAVVIKAPPGKSAMRTSAKSHVEFVRFRVDGSTGKDAVYWQGGQGNVMRECEVLSSPKSGVEVSASGLELENCVIRNATDDGVTVTGASTVMLKGGSISDCNGHGVRLSGACVVTVRGVVISGVGKDGVALAAAGPTVTVRETTIRGGERGVAVERSSSVTVVNTLMHGMSGDGVVCDHNSAVVAVWHATIADVGGHGVQVKNGSVTVRNSVVWSKGGAGLRRAGGTLASSHNVLYGGTWSGTVQGSGEVYADPQFVENGVNFRLREGSPAVNAGTSAAGMTVVDLAGSARPFGGGWDAGCYEAGSGSGGQVAPARIVRWRETEPQ